LSEFKSQIDGIISNIINERQANIQRKDYDEVKEDHGSKVDLEAFNIESKREYYSKKLQDLIEFRQYMEDYKKLINRDVNKETEWRMMNEFIKRLQGLMQF